MANSSIPQQVIFRPENTYPPCLWGDMFSAFDEEKHMHMVKEYTKEVEELKEVVKNMVKHEETSILDKAVLIDTIQRLGLSYHFEKEIEEQLEHIYLNSITKGYDEDAEDLFSMSLRFRLLRQSGFNISCDALRRFKSGDGGFMEVLKNDIRGLLALYEASHWRTHGEDILDEALSFTIHHLKSFVAKNSCNDSTFSKQIDHALYQELHKGLPRVETRHFVSIYEESDTKQEMLLHFAKIDFNLLQIQHKKELFELSRWWKTLDKSKVGYARDRLVECYFWASSIFYEPQHFHDRILVAKLLCLASILDDTYDVYATLSELDAFTNAVQRWNIGELDQLPDYMKITYVILLELFAEFEQRLTTGEDEKNLVINYLKEAMKQFIRGYQTEAEWSKGNSFPKFEEFMRIGAITTMYWVILPVSWLGIFNTLDRNSIYDVISKLFDSRLVRASAISCRMVSDISAYEREKQMNQVVTGIDCYIKEHCVSKEEAIHKFQKINENAWKDINEGCFINPTMPKSLISRIFNLCRGTYVFYKFKHDSYTYPAKVLKPLIISVLVEPISTLKSQ